MELVRATSKIVIEPWRLAEDKEAHATGKCGGPGQCPACTLQKALYEFRNKCVFGINLAIRSHWKAEGELYDYFMAEQGRAPKGDEWKDGYVDTYQRIRKAVPDLSSGIASALQRKAFAKWREKRFDALVRQICAPPHYKQSLPIPLRGQDFKFARNGKPKMYDVSFSLSSGRHEGGKEWKVPVRAQDHFQDKVLGNIADGQWKGGEASIQQDRLRRGKWYLTLTYKRNVESVPASQRVASINRGIKNFIVVHTYDNESLIIEGNDIEAYLKQIQSRRRSYQKQVKASGRRGRGRKRTLKPITILEGKGERWRKTRCQTIARSVTDWLLARKITTLYIEDFTGIRDGLPESLEGGKFVWDRIQEWPYFQLQTRLLSCLDEAGIEHVVVPAQYISQTCPKCGFTEKENKNLKNWFFRCGNCKFKAHLDITAAMNVMKKGQEGEVAAKGKKKGGKK